MSVNRTPRLVRLAEQRKVIQSKPSKVPMDGTIAKLPKDMSPMMDALMKARSESRPARSNDYVHVSDLLNGCMRRIALVEKIGLPARPQELNLFNALTYAQGDVIHDVIKQRTTMGGPKVVWGNWRCICGKLTTPSPRLFSEVDKEECSRCGQPMTLYKEVALKDHKVKITGSPDLFTYVEPINALHINELKSISEGVWKELVRPLPEHVLQVVFYWHLARINKYRLTDKASIVYVSKGWLFSGSPCKEFMVNPQEHLERLEPLIAQARSIKQAREGGNLPDRICINERSAPAKKCEVCSACFGVNANAAPRTVSISEALNKRARD